MKDNRYIAFDKAWFTRNQALLLSLLNSRITHSYTRHLLKVDEKVPYRVRVLSISPNSISYTSSPTEISTSLYADNYYGLQIYNNFKYLWQLIHYWDTKVANVYLPSLNLGYDTLSLDNIGVWTGGTVTRGGGIPNARYTWSQFFETTYIHDGGWTGDGEIAASQNLESGLEWHSLTGVKSALQVGLDKYAFNHRGIIVYDSSTLPNGTTTSAIINTRLLSPPLVDGVPMTPLTGSPACHVVSLDKTTLGLQRTEDAGSYRNGVQYNYYEDWFIQKYGTTPFASITWAQNMVDPGHESPFTFNLNSSGLSYITINTLTYLAFGLILNTDITQIEPSFYYAAESRYEFLWKSSSIDITINTSVIPGGFTMMI